VLRLEYGEAHVALRAGPQPQEPDNVVQKFYQQPFTLCATKGYIAARGPLRDGEWDGHSFVGSEDRTSRAPFFQWLERTIPEQFVTFRASQQRAAEDAIMAGAGIGFLPVWEAEGRDEIVQLLPAREEWTSQTWLVTHVDLHRTAKVQTLVQFLKDRTKDW
jgi:DNA-binding transcriptional LysR family regulator